METPPRPSFQPVVPPPGRPTPGRPIGEDAKPAPPRTGVWFRRVVALLIALWAIMLAVSGSRASYWAEQRNDQYQLISLGQCVHSGQHLYVDCWENKPPGIAWINALAITVGGGRQIAAWIAPGVVTLLCLGIMAWALIRVLSPAAAAGAVLIGAVVTTLRLYDSPSINPDFYASMLGLAACSLWLVAVDVTGRGRRVWIGLVSGLLWAAATGVKQTGVVGLLAVSLFTILPGTLKGVDRRRWLWAGVSTWIGFVVGVGAVTGVLYSRGNLEPAWAAIYEFNRGLLSWGSLGGALTSWSRAADGLAPVQLALWLALIGVIATLFAGRVNRLPRSFALAMLVWWLVQVVLSLLGPSRSMRYWQATWPAMLLLAGAGIYHFELACRQVNRGLRSVVAIAGITIVVLLGRPLYAHYQEGLASSNLAAVQVVTERDHYRALGEDLQALIPEGESIYVWAYDAGTYLYTDRAPASRFTYPRSEAQMEQILADLEAGRAYAILVPSKRSAVFDGWCDEACKDRLVEVLGRYLVQATVGEYDVWLQPKDATVETPSEPEPEVSPIPEE